jgi:hypothetical protein
MFLWYLDFFYFENIFPKNQKVGAHIEKRFKKLALIYRSVSNHMRLEPSAALANTIIRKNLRVGPTKYQ